MKAREVARPFPRGVCVSQDTTSPTPLVAPEVVVTLGNFASRLLLDTTEGIRRLRGRTYRFGSRSLVPTYHPAAALRGGGGEVLAEMRADLVRAKQELGSRS